MTESKQVQSVDDLLQRLRAGVREFYIVLAGGGIRSSKDIDCNEEATEFYIFQGISGTVDTYTLPEMLAETNIGRALEVGALYQY